MLCVCAFGFWSVFLCINGWQLCRTYIYKSWLCNILVRCSRDHVQHLVELRALYVIDTNETKLKLKCWTSHIFNIFFFLLRISVGSIYNSTVAKYLPPAPMSFSKLNLIDFMNELCRPDNWYCVQTTHPSVHRRQTLEFSVVRNFANKQQGIRFNFWIHTFQLECIEAWCSILHNSECFRYFRFMLFIYFCRIRLGERATVLRSWCSAYAK